MTKQHENDKFNAGYKQKINKNKRYIGQYIHYMLSFLLCLVIIFTSTTRITIIFIFRILIMNKLLVYRKMYFRNTHDGLMEYMVRVVETREHAEYLQILYRIAWYHQPT